MKNVPLSVVRALGVFVALVLLSDLFGGPFDWQIAVLRLVISLPLLVPWSLLKAKWSRAVVYFLLWGDLVVSFGLVVAYFGFTRALGSNSFPASVAIAAGAVFFVCAPSLLLMRRMSSPASIGSIQSIQATTSSSAPGDVWTQPFEQKPTFPMPTTPKGPQLEAVMPLFIVGSLARTVEFYTERLGFELEYSTQIFAILRRDRVGLMFKELASDTPPLPNPRRHPWARWDAYIYTPEPDALSDEFAARKIKFVTPITDTDEGLRAFEIEDPDGYVLCFGRPK